MMKKAKQGAVIGGVRGLLQLRWIGKYISEKKFFGAKTDEDTFWERHILRRNSKSKDFKKECLSHI